MTRPTVRQRWESRVADLGTDGCWTWTGSLNNCGYGNFSMGGKPTLAHRAAYLLHVGEIPAGMTLDHLCRNRACVNPSHLEAVTQAVNLQRSPLIGRWARTEEFRARESARRILGKPPLADTA